jgi:hypothetical protein
VSEGLPDPPETLALLEEGLHGLRLELPVDRDRLPRYAAAVLVALAVLALGLEGALLVPALIAAWLILPDRRRAELALDGATLTLASTTLGVLRRRRIPLGEITTIDTPSDPPELVLGTAAGPLHIPWDGTPTELGWLAAAIRHQVEAVRAAGPTPEPPPELERLRTR